MLRLVHEAHDDDPVYQLHWLLQAQVSKASHTGIMQHTQHTQHIHAHDMPKIMTLAAAIACQAGGLGQFTIHVVTSETTHDSRKHKVNAALTQTWPTFVLETLSQQTQAALTEHS